MSDFAYNSIFINWDSVINYEHLLLQNACRVISYILHILGFVENLI